jgi:hypothetical protein
MKRLVGIGLLTVLVGLLFACAGPRVREDRELLTHTQAVELGGAEEVEVELNMGAGDMQVLPETAGGLLMDGTFITNVPRWRPEIRYRVEESVGRLEVKQPGGDTVSMGGTRNHWTVRLNPNVPMKLQARLGAGKNQLDLRGTYLRALDINMGVGECTVDLRGKWRKDVGVRVRGGVGKVRILAPSGIGVAAHARGGIGNINVQGLHRQGERWVNDAASESPIMMQIDAEGGIGQIEIIAERDS